MFRSPHNVFLYKRPNELVCDFNLLNRDMQSNLLSTYRLAGYGSQLSLFYYKASDIYCCAWRKIIRKLYMAITIQVYLVEY